MMRVFPPFSSTAMLCAIALGMSGLVSETQAQLANPGNLSNSYDAIQAQYEDGNFEGGLRSLEELFEYWGTDGPDTLGSRFGHFFYLEGLIYMGLAEFHKAIDSFETCAERFPDKKGNLFVAHAIAQKGVCELILEDYKDAIKSLRRAMAEAPEDKPDPDRALIALNLARACLRDNQLTEGLRILHQSLDNDEVKIEYREAAFVIAAEEWSPGVPFEKVREFVDQYGDLARMVPLSQRQSRLPIFQHLAQEALLKDDPMRALLWYAQIASPSEILLWYQEKVDDLKRRKPAEDHANFPLWEEQFEAAFADGVDARLNVANLLYGTGAAHFRLSNHMASFSLFQHLADNFPNHPRQPEILYNTVVSALQLERWADIRKYGLAFMDRFPKHDLLAEVARVIVETPFARGVYDEAWTTTQEVRNRLPVSSSERDIPDFVAGASLFHLNRFHESRVELEAYTYNYPEGFRMEPVRYYLGAANVKEFKWDTAAQIFNDFLRDYPGSDMTPGVLYLNGLTHYAIGKYDRSLALVTDLQSRFPEALEIPASWNLTGDLLAIQENPAPLTDIESAYLRARDLARQRGGKDHNEIAAYALWKLIAIHHDATQWKEAVTYFDEFQKDHAESAHRLDALAAALEALHYEDRTREAISLLEKNLRELADSSTQFDELFGTYFDYVTRHKTAAETVTILSAFSKTTDSDSARNWLKIAEIEQLEKNTAPDEAKLSKLYIDLDLASEDEAMPNYGLIKLARHNRALNHLQRARELCLDIIENRPRRGHLEAAVLDLAMIDAKSDDPLAIQRAFANFTRIIDEFDSPELYETATIGLGRLQFDEKNYTEAEYYFAYYLSQHHWTQSRAEANFKLGRCYEESGRIQEAIKLFAITYVNFPGTLEWSTEAYLRAANLLKSDGRDGDALLVMVDFLKRLGHLEHKNITEGRRLFDDWKAEWVAKQQTAKATDS